MKHVTDKINLIHSVRRVTIIIFAIGVLAFTVVGLLDQYTLVKNETKKIRSEYTDKQKQIVKTQVQSTTMFINLTIESGVSREDIIEAVRKVKFGKEHDGYIFIVTYDGEAILIDPQRHLEGKNIWDITDPNGVKIVQEERRAVRNPDGDFIYYSWYQPSTAAVTPKVSFMKGVPDWEWMVGAGVYLDSVEEDITALQKEIMKATGSRILVITIILLVILFIIQIIFRRFTETVTSEIQLFSSYFDSAAVNNMEIDISDIRYSEFSHIAEDMNRMVINKLEVDAQISASEQRLQLQKEQSPLGYVEWDLDNKLIDWNLSAERIFGYSRDEILGKGFEFLISPDLIDSISDVIAGLVEATGETRNINDNIAKDGRTITCEWYNKVLTDQDGKIISIVSLVDDITERKLMEDRLQKSLEEKKILLKEVHHRVKNNMAIISSFISLQSMTVEDEYIRNLLRSSENRIRSMALIHEHLYRSENLKDINVQIYIDELLMALLDSYSYGASDISTKIEIIQFELDLDLLIPLGMLINEIISNALKHAFTNIDSPELSISLVMDISDELTLTISDNGIGLPEENEINQNDSIGFMLINGLVQQIDGKMEIRRENGTEYKITVPV